MNDKISGVGRRIIQTTKTIGKDGKIAKKVLNMQGLVSRGFLKTLKVQGLIV
ncbi:MAG: hypothetical protein CM15mV42_1010 [uncultured marine virus]|nr:MAG: hypothetical protein CM15mV42_1010 [uncultured marine virus]